jgi:hypothetical protein
MGGLGLDFFAFYSRARQAFGLVFMAMLVMSLALSNLGCAMSIAKRYPRATIFKVCVHSPGTTLDATHWIYTDDGVVSNVQEELFDEAARHYGKIFEFNARAPSTSVLWLPTPHDELKCSAGVLPSREEIEKAARSSLVMSAEARAELVDLVEKTCDSARKAGLNPQLVGQNVGPAPPILGRGNPAFVKRVQRLLGIEPIPELEPAKPPRSDPPVRMLDDPATETVRGLASGVTIGMVPFGAVGSQVLIEGDVLPSGTPDARKGKAIGEIAVGMGQIVVGCTGTVVGGGATLTGGGAGVGIPVVVVSAPMALNGVITACNGLRSCVIELWRADESQAPTVTTPPPAAGMRPREAPPPPPTAKAPPAGKTATNAADSAAKRAAPSGQLHHGISERVFEALEKRAKLKGVFKLRDPQFTARAATLEDHNGYQKWHVELDRQIVNYINETPDLDPKKFASWLYKRYSEPDLLKRFPGGLGANK